MEKWGLRRVPRFMSSSSSLWSSAFFQTNDGDGVKPPVAVGYSESHLDVSLGWGRTGGPLGQWGKGGIPT